MIYVEYSDTLVLVISYQLSHRINYNDLCRISDTVVLVLIDIFVYLFILILWGKSNICVTPAVKVLVFPRNITITKSIKIPSLNRSISPVQEICKTDFVQTWDIVSIPGGVQRIENVVVTFFLRCHSPVGNDDLSLNIYRRRIAHRRVIKCLLTLGERMPPYSRHHRCSKKIECRRQAAKQKKIPDFCWN